MRRAATPSARHCRVVTVVSQLMQASVIGGKAWDVFNVGLYRYGVVNKASCVLFGTKVQVWCSLRVVLY